MTLERIMQAAINSMIHGHHAPHCYSAHVPGQGYVNDGNLIGEARTDYLRQLERSARSEVENMGFASGYAEPGYHNPAKGIVFANWNTFPSGLDTLLERAGYAIEWSDEWSMCEDCGKAVRTSENSYRWQPSYVMPDECSIVCLDCVDWASYLESIEDNADIAVMRACDPSEYGYERLSEAREYESGWHPGQNDSPREILEKAHAAGLTGILFRIADTRQFDIHFETWIKVQESDNA